MVRWSTWLVICCLSALTTAGCLPRMVLTVAPQDFEGQFVRSCELLDEQPALRDQPATLAALAAIRPAGRFCFVCRRLNRCQAQLGSLGLDDDPTARQLALQAASLASRPPPAELPPPGGPGLRTARQQLCRACASMPVRIQEGTWDP